MSKILYYDLIQYLVWYNYCFTFKNSFKDFLLVIIIILLLVYFYIKSDIYLLFCLCLRFINYLNKLNIKWKKYQRKFNLVVLKTIKVIQMIILFIYFKNLTENFK